MANLNFFFLQCPLWLWPSPTRWGSCWRGLTTTSPVWPRATRPPWSSGEEDDTKVTNVKMMMMLSHLFPIHRNIPHLPFYLRHQAQDEKPLFSAWVHARPWCHSYYQLRRAGTWASGRWWWCWWLNLWWVNKRNRKRRLIIMDCISHCFHCYR